MRDRNKKFARAFYRALKRQWQTIEYHSWDNGIDAYFEYYDEDPYKHKKYRRCLMKALLPLSIPQGDFIPKIYAFKVKFKEQYGVWP